MIDFKDMKYGAIKTSDGLVIVINGTFHGPFNQKEMETVFKVFEEVQGK